RLQRDAQIALRSAESHDIEWGPQRAAGEHRDAVDVDEQAVALDVVLGGRARGERPEADSGRGQRLRRAAVAGPDATPVQRGLAVGMRPPGRHVRDPELAVNAEAGIVDPAGDRGPSHTGRALDLDVHGGSSLTVQAPHQPADRENAVRAVEPGADGEIVEDDPAAPLQLDGSPRTDDRRPWRESRDAPDERRSEPAQVVIGNETRSPAGARPALRGKLRRERPEADRQLVAAAQARADVDRVPLEHRLAAEDRLTVQEDLGERRQATEAEQDLLAGLGR